MGKPHWRREEALDGGLALIMEQVERVRRERSSRAGEIRLFFGNGKSYHKARDTDSQNKLSSVVTPDTLDGYDP